MSNRINPAQVNGTITATGTGNAIGPYKFRIGASLDGVNIYGYSTNATDVFSVIVVPPGTDFTNANNQIIAKTALTCPNLASFSNKTAVNMLPSCDIYVYATTCTGTMTVAMERISSTSRV